MVKPPMTSRNFRCPDPLWQDAKAVADQRGEDLSDVLRDALTRYVKKGNR